LRAVFGTDCRIVDAEKLLKACAPEHNLIFQLNIFEQYFLAAVLVCDPPNYLGMMERKDG
jgi:hypothetical protein